MIVTGFQQNIALKQSRCLTVAQPAAKRSIRADLPFARQSKKKCGIFYEPGMRNGNKPTDGLLWYPRRAVFDTSHQKRPCALRGGTGGYDAGWARSRWRTALTTGTGACHAPVGGGERTDSPTEVGGHPDAFEVTLPRLLTFGFGCGGFVLREALMADHRIELSGKFPANGFLRGWIVIEMIED